ncbi:MAG: hypothetical protein ACLQNE_40650 [Thermoguttaceae bacterium]
MMFNSLKACAVVMGLVGAVLASSNAYARGGHSAGHGVSHSPGHSVGHSAGHGVSHSGSRSHIGSSKISAPGGNHNFKPASTLSKPGHAPGTNKFANFAKGNPFPKANPFSKGSQLSKGTNNFGNKLAGNKLAGNKLAGNKLPGNKLAGNKLPGNKDPNAKHDNGYRRWGPGWGFGGYDGWDGGDWSGYGDFGSDDGAGGYVDASPAEATRAVTVINPATTGTALSFAVGCQNYTLQAGESRNIDTTSGSVIEFDRGTGNSAQYTLSDGPYTFGATTNGWELYRGNLTSALPAPTPAVESYRRTLTSAASAAAAPAVEPYRGTLTAAASE